MTLKPHVQEILANTRGDEGIFADTFAFGPMGPAEESLGNLYLLGEIRNASERTSFIVNLVATVIRREYYENPKRGIQESFQRALKKANTALHELSRQGYEEWLGNLRFAVVAFSESQLRLAVLGGAELLLIREQQIMELTRDASPPGGGLFVSTVRGKVYPDDILLLANRPLRELTKKRDLTLAKLPEYLVEHSSPTAVLLLNFQEGKSVPQPQEKKPHALRTTPESQKSIPPRDRMPSPQALLHSLRSKMRDVNVSPKAFTDVFLRNVPRISLSGFSFSSMLRILRKFRLQRVLRNILALERFHMPTKEMVRGGLRWRPQLPKNRRRLLPVAGFLLVGIFTIGLLGLFQARGGTDIREVGGLLKEAQESIAQAETVLIYGDEQRATTLLEHARAQAEQALALLPEHREARGVRDDALEKLHTLTGVIPVTEGIVLMDFSRLPVSFQPKTIIGVSHQEKSPVLFLTDPDSPGFYRYDTETQQGKFVLGELSGSGFSETAALPETPSMIGFLHGPVLLLYDARENRFVDGRTLQEGRDVEGKALATYRENFYVLDSTSGEIIKIPIKNDRLAKPVRWNARGTADILNQGTDIAVDGLIWVLLEDGSIHQFANGAYRKEFSLAALGENISPKHLATSEALETLLLLVPAQNRLIFVDKESGEISKQYVGPAWQNAEDFWLTDDTTAFVLNATELIRLDLPAEE